MPKPPPPESPFWKLFGGFTKVHVGLFRVTKGKVGGRAGKMKFLVLHHVGAKSGTKRETPLLYLDDGDRVVIVASKGGVDKHPGWLHNLRAHPETEVELPGGERRRVRAREATASEREALWPRLDAMYPPYRDYRSYTERVIPLVLLERA